MGKYLVIVGVPGLDELVHVELAQEGREVVVLEVGPQHSRLHQLGRGDEEVVAVVTPSDYIFELGLVLGKIARRKRAYVVLQDLVQLDDECWD